MARRSTPALLLMVALAACTSAPTAPSPTPSLQPIPSPTAASSAGPTSTPTPTLPWTLAEAREALVAFEATVRDPGYHGTGRMEAVLTREGQPDSPDGAITGTLAWDGVDISQSIVVERTVPFPPIPKVDTRVRGETGFIRICAFTSCFNEDAAWWTRVDEAEVDGLTLVHLLRGDLDLAYAGRESVDGAVWNRLQGTVDDLRPLGWVTRFGQRTAPDGSTAEVEILTDADGRPALVRARTEIEGFGSTGALDVEWRLTSEVPNGLELPQPRQTLAYVYPDAGYRIAVPMSWTYIPGKPGGVDRFVAPKADGGRELRLRLALLDQSILDHTYADGGLGQRLADEYDATIQGSYGGFMGAINAVAVTLDATIDGRPTTIQAGTIYWQGACPGSGLDCRTKFSILELWSAPGDNPDLAFDFFNQIAMSIRWVPLEG